MDETLKGFRRFLARDLVFVIGGGAVVGSFLHLFNRLPAANDSWVLFGLLAGVGYLIAYALQDVLSLTPLVTTVSVQNPNRFVRWLYRRFMRESWTEIGPKIDADLNKALDNITDEAQLDRLERIIMLKQVGTAGGPCMALCGIFFFVRWSRAMGEQMDLFVAIAGLTLGVTLVCLGWLKCAQQAQFIAKRRSK